MKKPGVYTVEHKIIGTEIKGFGEKNQRVEKNKKIFSKDLLLMTVLKDSIRVLQHYFYQIYTALFIF